MLAIALLVSFFVTLFTTPYVIRFAFRKNVLDVPDSRKIHRKPIPYLGGISLFFGFFIPVFFFFARDFRVVGILFCSALIVLIGVYDDIFSLRPKIKLLGELFVGLLISFLGVSIQYIVFPFGIVWNVGILGVPFTMLCVAGVINTINIIDGVDGLAAGVTVIVAGFFAYISYSYGLVTPLLISVSLMGACLGFLKFNFSPARIFMGDAGSMLLGFILAILAIQTTYSIPNQAVAFFVPIIILGYPISDTVFAIVRRYSLGEPIFSPDKRHFHHHLVRRGFSSRQSVLILYMASVLCGVTALSFIQLGFLIGCLISLIVVLFAILFIKVFRKKRKKVLSFFKFFLG